MTHEAEVLRRVLPNVASRCDFNRGSGGSGAVCFVAPRPYQEIGVVCMSGANADTRTRLTKEQMEQLLNALDAGVQEAPDCRRRSERRASRGLAIIVAPLIAGSRATTHRVWTRNVSQHGMAFLHNYVIPVGTLVTIELPVRTPTGDPVVKECIVRRCRHLEGMTHEIGVEFCSFAEIRSGRKAEQARPDRWVM